MEMMMRLPPLGDRKPSVMLAEMLKFCPAGESSTAVLAFLYLQQLPSEIRVLLSEDDPADMQAIAEKADRLIAMHVPQSHDACAAASADISPEEADVVATMEGTRSCKGKASQRPQRPQQQSLGRRIDLAKKGQEQNHPLSTSMCFYYAKFGEQTKYCQKGCVWPEN
jgi:hypothetical protein